MIPTFVMNASCRYSAFISYSHARDSMLSRQLQTGLHKFAKPWYALRSLRVFRDETALELTNEVFSSIAATIEQCDFLILIASPESARSKWVPKEIEHALRVRGLHKILLVLTGGALEWSSDDQDFDWSSTTALPKVLKGVFKEEPLYVDLREFRDPSADFSMRNPIWLQAIARISARLRDCSLDDLVGEDIRQHRVARRIAMAAIAALSILMVAACLFAYLANQARDHAESSLQASLIDQARLHTKNAEFGIARQLVRKALELKPSSAARAFGGLNPMPEPTALDGIPIGTGKNEFIESFEIEPEGRFAIIQLWDRNSQGKTLVIYDCQASKSYEFFFERFAVQNVKYSRLHGSLQALVFYNEIQNPVMYFDLTTKLLVSEGPMVHNWAESHKFALNKDIPEPDSYIHVGSPNGRPLYSNAVYVSDDGSLRIAHYSGQIHCEYNGLVKEVKANAEILAFTPLANNMGLLIVDSEGTVSIWTHYHNEAVNICNNSVPTSRLTHLIESAVTIKEDVYDFVSQPAALGMKDSTQSESVVYADKYSQYFAIKEQLSSGQVGATLFDLSTGQVQYHEDCAQIGRPTFMDISLNASHFAFGTDAGILHIVDMPECRLASHIDLKDPILKVKFTSDCRSLIVLSQASPVHPIRIHRISLPEAPRIELYDPIFESQVSENRSTLYVAGFEGICKIDLRKGYLQTHWSPPFDIKRLMPVPINTSFAPLDLPPPDFLAISGDESISALISAQPNEYTANGTETLLDICNLTFGSKAAWADLAGAKGPPERKPANGEKITLRNGKVSGISIYIHDNLRDTWTVLNLPEEFEVSQRTFISLSYDGRRLAVGTEGIICIFNTHSRELEYKIDQLSPAPGVTIGETWIESIAEVQNVVFSDNGASLYISDCTWATRDAYPRLLQYDFASKTVRILSQSQGRESELFESLVWLRNLETLIGISKSNVALFRHGTRSSISFPNAIGVCTNTTGTLLYVWGMKKVIAFNAITLQKVTELESTGIATSLVIPASEDLSCGVISIGKGQAVMHACGVNSAAMFQLPKISKESKVYAASANINSSILFLLSTTSTEASSVKIQELKGSLSEYWDEYCKPSTDWLHDNAIRQHSRWKGILSSYVHAVEAEAQKSEDR